MNIDIEEVKINISNEIKRGYDDYGQPTGILTFPSNLEIYKKALEQQQARIKELEKASEWVSVDNRMPEDVEGHIVLGFSNDQFYECEFEDGIWCNITGETMTHWKPLPKPPEEKS